MITFSRAKIALPEVTQGKAWSLTRRGKHCSGSLSVNSSGGPWGCVEICNVLSGKQFIATETHGRSHTSPDPPELYFYLRSCSEKPVLCKAQPSGSIPHTVYLHRAHLQWPFIYPSIHPSLLSALLIGCPLIMSYPSKATRTLLSQSNHSSSSILSQGPTA